MKSKILGLLAVGLFAGSMASGTPLAYDESVSGDIPGDGLIASWTTTFLLDVGVNTVSGTQSGAFRSESDSVFDSDPFYFVVPTGAALDSFSLAWSNGRFSNLRSGGITSCNLFDGSVSLIERVGLGPGTPRCVEVTTDPAGTRQLFTLSLPLVAGTYAWFPGSGGAGTAPWSWSVDYVLSLGVRNVSAPVPEPGTLALLGLGLAGLGLSRRRKAA